MRRLLLIPASLLATACSAPGAPTQTPSQPAPTPQPGPSPIRVLVLTATAAFRHDSIPVARQTMAELASRSGSFSVNLTEDLPSINATSLASTDVLMFALTTGELPLDGAQREAIVAFIDRGGGFIGVHSASDTLYGWSDYGRIVGAYFREHPWTQEAGVTVENRAHPISAGLSASFRLLEEFYTFRQNPRGSVDVLLTLDAASVNAQGDYPLAWTQTIGRGRSYYNALGHFDSTWRDAAFQTQMTNAIRWVANR